MSVHRLCLAALLAVTGCSPVAAWQRETLASERMRLDSDADAVALTDARRAVREEGHVGAPGSTGSSAAGGCGCN